VIEYYKEKVAELTADRPLEDVAEQIRKAL